MAAAMAEITEVRSKLKGRLIPYKDTPEELPNPLMAGYLQAKCRLKEQAA
ncbi:MAG: hypothetical protein WEB37_00010 [Bacteroidota bacterium]